MSAAVNLAAVGVGIDASVSLDLEPLPVDAEITIYGSLDADTEEAIQNARRAAEKLREEYGIEVIVNASTIYWGQGVGLLSPATPVVYVNGRALAEGRIPTVDEIVEAVLSLLGSELAEPPAPLPPAGKRRGETSAAAIW